VFLKGLLAASEKGTTEAARTVPVHNRSGVEKMKYHMVALVLGLQLLSVLGVPALAGAAETNKPVLLGTVTRDSLQQEPYATWFDKNYEEYIPNAEVIAQLSTAAEDMQVKVFFGSWCGDSKREVPRLLKVLDAISFPSEDIELIAVSNADSLKRQSPDGEERGLEVFRVPVIIVQQKGSEVSRIVEHPVLSLERDLLAIVSHQDYTPNYPSFVKLSQWLDAGLLSDENVSYRGLAKQIDPLVSSEGDLNTAGAVLQARGQLPEAVKVFEMNVALFPKSASRRLALAEVLVETEDYEYAERTLKRAAQLNDDPNKLKRILELLEEVQEQLREQEKAAKDNDDA